MSIHNATCQNQGCSFNIPGNLGDEAEVPKFCPDCGSPVIEKCTNEKCGVELAPDLHPKFCSKCGQQLRFYKDPVTGKLR
jgi:hypothetical protein